MSSLVQILSKLQNSSNEYEAVKIELTAFTSVNVGEFLFLVASVTCLLPCLTYF